MNNHHFITTQEKPSDNSSSTDPFDLLPDDILLSIFLKLNDAKSLCKSMAVCKRFHYIAPQVDEISYEVSQKEPDGHQHTFKNPLAKILSKKPFNVISRLIKPKPKKEENELDFYSSYIPNRVLKPFHAVRSLNLTLPTAKLRKNKNPSTFLKWEAVYGRQIQSCVILGANSWTEKGNNDGQPSNESREGATTMFEEELKLRIVWTISCLIAASARHYLVRKTVREKKTIENVVVSDESAQGSLYLNEEGIQEIRDHHQSMGKEKGSSPTPSDDGWPATTAEYRSKVPALEMKLWFLDRIERPDLGKVMDGATLVVIRPAACGGAEAKKMEYGELAMRAFGEDLVLCGVVEKLIAAKKCYTMEMNSF